MSLSRCFFQRRRRPLLNSEERGPSCHHFPAEWRHVVVGEEGGRLAGGIEFALCLSIADY